jgi:anti-sigma factor RsiW
MNCKYNDGLAALLDGELDDARAKALRAHIESCADCRRRVSYLKRSYAALEALEGVEAPAGFAARVNARARRKLVRMPFYAGGAIAVAATLLLMLAVHGVGNRSHATPTHGPVAVAVSPDELPVVENMDALENYDLISDLDLLSDYDALTTLDDAGVGASS